MPSPTIDLEPLLISRRDTARLLGLSPRQVDLMIERDKLAHVRIGRRVMIPLDAVRGIASTGTTL